MRHMTVFHRVPVNIIDVFFKFPVAANGVFPIASSPDGAQRRYMTIGTV